MFTGSTGSIVETEHGTGLFLFTRALAIAGTLRSCCTLRTFLLHTEPVLFLCAGSLLARLVHAVLSIMQALPLSGCCTRTLSPEPGCHYSCRDEDQCDDRTDQDFFIHCFNLLVVAGSCGFFDPFSCRSCIKRQHPLINDFPERQLHIGFSGLNSKNHGYLQYSVVLYAPSFLRSEQMKPGIVILAFLMLALVALPLAPYGESAGPGAPDQFPGRSGAGHAYRYGGGSGMMPHNGAMQGSGPMPQAARHGQERSAQSPVQQELNRDPFDWNAKVGRMRFRGYRRLSGKNILEHEKRLRIYSAILMNPGIEVPTLASRTGINLHTLRYHLSYLVRMGKITCIEQGGGHHFFENHGRYTPADQQQILFHNYPTTNRIITLIEENPGVTRGEIADRLGLAGPSVTRWMQRLIAGGIITEVHEGRYVRYYSSPALSVASA
jgi:DNA-binding MarR family transcriptional regulator